MRVIYRIAASAVAVVLAVTAGVVLLVTRDARQVPVAAAPPLATPALTTGPSPISQPVTSEPATSAPTTSEPTGSPPATSQPTASRPAAVEPASAGTGSASPTPTPGMSPLQAALADPRIPGLPGTRKLGKLPGRSAKVKKWIKDRRSRVAVARLAGTWKLVTPSPFATRQVLPTAKGAGHRALLVSCPVPTLVQDELRDTALIAARWTLNHQPGGSKIKWVASQPAKVGERDAWLLAYQVKYTVKGQQRLSMAATLLTEVPDSKPALLFVSIPDSQKKRWRDINTVISTLKIA